MTPDQIEQLVNLAPGEYAQVVLVLLREPVGDKAGLRGLDYRSTYRCRMDGCLLFLLRPSIDLYDDVPVGALGIADPSDIQYGAAALQQVKSSEQVALDLIRITGKYKDDDETLAHIFDLFYWLGFTAKSLLQPRVTISLPEAVVPVSIERTPPEPDPTKVTEVAYQIAEHILETLERQNTGQAARSCIGLLTCCNIDAFPSALRRRIIQAYVRASSSPDEYMRNRVRAPNIIELIRSFKRLSDLQ